MTCLSTALDRLNMGQSDSRQQLGIAAFSGDGLASQWDVILPMAAFAMTGAAVIARTAIIIPARIDFNELILIYIIINQAQAKSKLVRTAKGLALQAQGEALLNLRYIVLRLFLKYGFQVGFRRGYWLDSEFFHQDV